MHVQLVATIRKLNDLETKTYGRPSIADSIVRVLDIIVENSSILKLHDRKFVKHIWGEILLLVEDEAQLVNEFDLNAMVVFDPGDMGNVASLCRELWLVRIKRVPLGRVLVTMLRVKELGIPLVEVIFEVIICNICEVQKVVQLGWLLPHGVEIDADLLGDWVLSTCIVQ